MAKQKYVIRQISALGIISASKRENGDRRFFFDATDTSKEYLVEDTKQDDCPMFYQAMRLLYGEGFHAEPDYDKLKDAILYIDFSGTFDRRRNTGGPDAVRRARFALFEQKWHLTPREDREKAWYSVVPSCVSSEYKEIFCNFRCSMFSPAKPTRRIWGASHLK